MKKIYTIALALLITASAWAQSPERMSYQAIVRDASNSLVTTQVVGMQISILQTTSTGTSVYVETQTASTNANGLVSLEIGTGTVESGEFAAIDWGNDTYFIKTETDPTGGTNYTITGTSQLLSVPYALHAKTAERIIGTGPHSLGEEFGGGVIFHLYIGSDGEQHGLIVNKSESTEAWQAGNGTTTNAAHSWDGVYNTGLMQGSAAATYVNGLSDGGFTDWYAPSIDELGFLWHNRYYANKALNEIDGAILLSSTAHYWSSTEYTAIAAFFFNFSRGHSYNERKNIAMSVRAVRAF